MQTLIAGGGGIGYKIATYLSEHGENVIIIDRDKSRCDWLCKNTDASVYNGNILDAALLMEAGIDKADSLVTALGNDETTLRLVDFAKSQFGIPKVIAVVKSADVTEKAKESGADKVVCSEEAVLKEIENSLRSNGRKTIYANRKTNAKIEWLRVKATSKGLGKEISKIQNRGDARIAMIARGEETVLPSDDFQLQMGDELFITGKDEAIEKLIEEIEGT
ncbi:MAG TPA: TrkA family potassium uptake protein [Nitrososphaerales archaeon]|nr:TrkA family potassium uptake protein [Nitrososphaerales archaeon]